MNPPAGAVPSPAAPEGAPAARGRPGAAALHFDSAIGQLAALRAGKVSASELLERAIARVEAHDARINAVVVRDFGRARAAAAVADAALARGETRPLLGLPMTVKEAIDVAGLPTTWGIEEAPRGAIAADALAVQRLKAAGAIVIGKSNVPTWLADWQCTNPIHGTTRNPFDPARTPGGSSGGAAAALAAGFVALELGSDLAGSLRVPAHCCGVFAHQPSRGLVPRRGFAPPGVARDAAPPRIDLGVLGPMARSVADLALALDVLAGAAAARLPPARHERLDRFRVLLLDAHPLVPTSREVRAAIEGFATRLAAAGCALARSSPLLPELARVASTFGELLGAFFGAGVAAPEVEAARAHIERRWRALFRAFDVVVCPVLPVVAFPLDDAPMAERRIDVDGVSLPYERLGAWSSLAALSGLPATTLPIGLGAKSALPVGVQAIGARLDDRTTLAFARHAERAFGGFVAPPGWD